MNSSPKVAIVNYGMGNLFSVKQACEHVGLRAQITSSREDLAASDAVVLPGVGAFGDAMDVLRELGLVDELHKVANSFKPFIGICLGMQLLMSESFEFGQHKGLDIVKGSVVRFENPIDADGNRLKVPQVGWNRIFVTDEGNGESCWSNSALRGTPNGEFMYFVHSFHVCLEDKSLCLSTTQYGDKVFCSSFRYKNIFACQFHPERSGPWGLRIYQNLASLVKGEKMKVDTVIARDKDI